MCEEKFGQVAVGYFEITRIMATGWVFIIDPMAIAAVQLFAAQDQLGQPMSLECVVFCSAAFRFITVIKIHDANIASARRDVERLGVPASGMNRGAAGNRIALANQLVFRGDKTCGLDIKNVAYPLRSGRPIGSVQWP
jgi:hypothetical protein